jgi:uncharacterized protein YrzB (UPF0473 family)
MTDREIITLTLESGETECEVLGVFDAGEGEDERQYIALLPVGETEVLVFRCFEAEEGFAEIENIDDDEEYNTATEAFSKLIEKDKQ